MNPKNMMKIRELLMKFTMNHPKIPPFSKAASEAIGVDSIIEITVTTADGKTLCTNMKVKPEDVQLMEEFKKKYPSTICWWRTKKHAKLVDDNLNPGEEVIYAFAAQNNNDHGNIFDTGVLALTNQRLIVAQNRLLIGYKINSITPELYNDMQINVGIIWGTVTIDTMKEVIYFSNISKKALPEIQITINSYMVEARKKNSK